MQKNSTFTTQLDRIEAYSLLAAKNVLTLADTALLTGLSIDHLYKLTSTKRIPHYKPNGKTIYFRKLEVEEWLLQNRVNTTQEAEQQAAAYVTRKSMAL